MVNLKNEKELLVSGMIGTNNPSELLFICSCMSIGYGCYACITHWLKVENSRRLQQQENQEPQQQTQAPKSSRTWNALLFVIFEILCFWIPMTLCQSVWLNSAGLYYVKGQVVIIMLSVLIIGVKRSRDSPTQTALTSQTTAETNNTVKNGNCPLSITTTTTETTNGSTSTSSSNICNNFYTRLTDSNPTTTMTTVMTIYRSCLMLLTIISILAVDFPVIYPRKHVKTEFSGYSLMDLGASSFVIAAGFMSSRARRGMTLNKSNDIVVGFSKRSIGKASMLLFTGIIRLLLHKGVEYQEHVSEYGVHWNFFFTLAWLSILPPIVSSSTSQPPSWVPSVIIFVIYQVMLSLPIFNLQEYVNNAPRGCDDSSYGNGMCFFTANREGILGCISYTGLYLLSEKIAVDFIWNDVDHSEHDQKQGNLIRHEVLPILSQSIIWTIVWQALVHVVRVDVSRRSTNIPFCIWSLVVNLWQITILRYITTIIIAVFRDPSYHMKNEKKTIDDDKRSLRESSYGSSKEFSDVPLVLNAFNKHGFLVFVVANLLTGIINLSMDTITVTSKLLAFVIVMGYVGITAGIVIAVDRVLPSFKRIGENDFRIKSKVE